MKKFSTLLLTAALVFTCVACGSEGDSQGSSDVNSEVQDSSEASTEEESEAQDSSEADASQESEAQDSSEASTEEESEAQDSSEAGEEGDAEGSEAGTEGAEGTEAKSEGVMTYAEYDAAALESEVVIETYVQAKQSWWEDKATVYTQDKDGAYFVYNMVCSEEDYEKLVPGTKIKVTGYKTEWSGEVEVAEGATFEILEGNYIAPVEDVTSLLGSDDLIKHQNKFVAFKGMTVEPCKDADGNNIKDADGNDVAFLYNWDGSGQEGDDLYFNVSLNGNTYTFTVESYLCDSSTDVYKAVQGLNIGDKIDMEGFLYWYEGVNPHITSVKTAE